MAVHMDNFGNLKQSQLQLIPAHAIVPMYNSTIALYIIWRKLQASKCYKLLLQNKG